MGVLMLGCSMEGPAVVPVFSDRPTVPMDAVVDRTVANCASEGAVCACAGGAAGVYRCLGTTVMCVCPPLPDVSAPVDAVTDVASDRAVATDVPAASDVATDVPARPDTGPPCAADTSTDPMNCGSCGHVCTAPANARAYCALGGCSYACLATFGDCDGNVANGCESSLRTVAHCGTCTLPCEIDNGVGACSPTAMCTVVSCMTGFADCDHAADNGCEADLGFNRLHCGTCGHVCTKACVDGACTM